MNNHRWNHVRAASVAVAACAVLAGSAVGLAHADDTTTTAAPAAESTAPAASDQIGLVSITQVAADGTTQVSGSVIQLERLPDTATPTGEDPTDTPTTTTTASSDTATTSPTSEQQSHTSALAFPVGAKFDVVTGKDAVILALPEGIYKLTHLGTTNNDQAPNAGDVTIRVISGRHVAGKLQEQAGTSTGTAPGVTAAPTVETTTPASTEADG